jgi:hypothetical protein
MCVTVYMVHFIGFVTDVRGTIVSEIGAGRAGGIQSDREGRIAQRGAVLRALDHRR